MKIKKKDVFKEPKVISIGAYHFYESIKQQTDNVVFVEWKPPAAGDKKALDALMKLKKIMRK